VPLDGSELYSPEWLKLKAAIAAHFAWAVPTRKAIATIAAYTHSVVEIGAGSGYWAWMMEQAGVSVVAFDKYRAPFLWHEVHDGHESMVAVYPRRTLFLCWPPFDNPMAADALALYKGEHVIFVGELFGGCAEAKFFALLNTQYDEVASVTLPQWFMRDDRLVVFRSKHYGADRRNGPVRVRTAASLTSTD
jgi:hypothetical protein